ncbi:SpoIID/LytB domain-containing protein [Prochlorococcus sp. MIT 1223]|uniref:SpoIID/LytB domain-containing protein n=1 Tax=Prochlorococcus sp. MIT 1223 TaxID=3096217 RepID=UPI002A7640A9|nr:SpoIID/LytB domain-containing protein [Prochlorococcus sp. MIT 1223]
MGPSFTKADDLIFNYRNIYFEESEPVKTSAINGSNKFLLVGLEPYLGQLNIQSHQAKDINLVSVAGKLVLTDSQGVIHKAGSIRIGWRKSPLHSSLTISRKTAGPFSSFESAEQFANRLKEAGIAPVVAYPKDWEVWVPHNAKIPKGIVMKPWEKSINTLVRPVLKVGGTDIPLSGNISIDAPKGLRWKSGIYSGPFFLKPDAYGSWTFIQKVSLKEYLRGVVSHEIGSGSPLNALASQAVLARTWALANSHRFAIDGYHLCSNTQCQVYKDPQNSSPELEKAIQITAGKVLSWKGKPIHAVYHATNGGVMASINEAWSVSSLPYLKTKLDGTIAWKKQFPLPLNNKSSLQKFLLASKGAYGNSHYRFRWKRIITSEKLRQVLDDAFPKSNNRAPIYCKVLQRGSSGRVLALQILGTDKKPELVLRLDSIRRIIQDLPSTLFVIDQLEEGVWRFSGGGFGHGAGLSQAGAIELARRGWDVDKILMHYYPGSIYGTLP